MKIVLTSNTSFSLYNFRLGLMKHLRDNGFDIIAVAPIDEYTKKLQDEFTFLPIHHLKRRGTNPVEDFKLFAEYLKLYSQLKPALVISYTIKPNIYSSLACGVLQVPSISVITGLGYVFARRSVLALLVKMLYRVAFKFNRYIVVLNSEDEKFIGTLTDRSKVVRFEGEGVNTSWFFPDRSYTGVKNKDAFIFLFLGRFLKDKGIRELVRAGEMLWKENKKFKIFLVGSVDYGNPSSLSERDIESFKKFEFIEIFPFSEDVRPFISRSDCLVLPSYYREGIPRVLLEGMAMEKPIITTNSPGCKEICENGVNGYLVEPMDVKGLYEAMKKCLYLPKEEIRRMGTENRKKVLKRFDERIIIEKYASIIKEITGTSANI